MNDRYIVAEHDACNAPLDNQDNVTACKLAINELVWTWMPGATTLHNAETVASRILRLLQGQPGREGE